MRVPPGLAAAILWSLGLAACATAPSAPARAHQEFGLLFVEVEGHAGGPLLALLDTGANASAVDPRRSAGLPAVDRVEIVGTTGSLAADRVALPGLRLGGRALPPLRATRRDLSGLLAPAGRRVDLILGSDAFAGSALAIDFVGGTVALGAPGDAAAPAVPMRLDDGIPTLPARLGGRELELRIDTGASLFATEDVYLNLPAAVFAAIAGPDPGVPAQHLQGAGASGHAVDLPVYRLTGARIGPLDLPSVFAIVQPAAGYFAAADARGFVSNNYLRRLGRVELDYAAGVFRGTGLASAALSR